MVKLLVYLRRVTMPIVRTADAVIHRLHGSTFTSYVSPAAGSTQLCGWRLDVAPGIAGVAHRVSSEEILVLLAGDLTVTLDGESAPLAVGDAVLVPAGSQLRIDNPADAAATAWVTAGVGLTAELPDGSWISPPWVN
jgi:quercetin dioxygenase-like cupin family protein